MNLKQTDTSAIAISAERSLLDSLPCAVFLVSKSRQIVSCNQTAAALFGSTKKALVGKPIALLAKQILSKTKPLTLEQLSSAEGYKANWQVKSAGQTTGWFSAEATLVSPPEQKEPLIRLLLTPLAKAGPSATLAKLPAAKAAAYFTATATFVAANKALNQLFGYTLQADTFHRLLGDEDNRKLRFWLHQHSLCQPNLPELKLTVPLRQGAARLVLTPQLLPTSAGGATAFRVLFTNDSAAHQARLQLQQEAARLRLIANNVQDVIAITDLAGYFTYLSPSFEKVFGFDPLAEGDDDGNKTIHPDDLQEVHLWYYDFITGNNPAQNHVYRKQHKTKGWIWVESGAQLVTQADGTPEGFVSIIRDISERIKNEEELRRQNQEMKKLTRVVEEATSVIILADNKGKIEWVNKRFAEVTGYSLAEVVGQKPGKLLQGLDTSKDTVKKIGKALAAGKSFRGEILNYHKNGNSYWLDLSISPIFNAEGQIENFFAIEDDITERKQVQVKLEQLNKQLQLVVSAAHTGYFDWNVTTDETFISDRLLQIFGYTHSGRYDQSSETLLRLLNTEVSHNTANRLTAFLSEEALAFEEEVHLLQAVGKELTISMRVIKHTEPSHVQGEEEIVRLIGSLQDITAVKEGEKKLVQQNAELLRLNEVLDKFLYSTYHDIRSPLSSMLGLINLARMEVDQSVKDQLLDRHEQNIKQLDRIVSKISDYAKNTQLELELSQVNLIKLLLHHIERCKYILGKEPFEVELPESFNLQTDKVRLDMIVRNLVLNSFHFRDSNRQLHIKVTAASGATGYTIRLLDNGIGMSPAIAQKVFDMFYRGSEQSKGSGLGLYVIAETVQKLNGKIRLYSVKGKGSCFSLWLPRNLNQQQQQHTSVL